MRSLEAEAREAIDRRLLPASPRPVAVALSGGGDSLALALIADAWARDAGRELVVLTVDHGLQAASRAWTEQCAATAARLGCSFRALAWVGAKPTTGLPAAARAARHRLIANAARETGARVVLMGHTADDLAEAALMRQAGATTPSPREWAPSPVWPEGRGLFILRPLLGLGRGDLRDWLAARGEAWIDDPANADPRYARSRARMTGQAVRCAGTAPRPPDLALAVEARERAGVIAISRAELRAARADEAARFVALAAVCAGGGERRPATARIARATEALRGGEPFVATLAGARIEADGQHVRIFREPGEAARGGLSPARLEPGRPVVWDGRFELAAAEAHCEVRRLMGLARRLPDAQQSALRELPAAARGGLPALLGPAGVVDCPALTGSPSLVGERLRAAAGLVTREPE